MASYPIPRPTERVTVTSSAGQSSLDSSNPYLTADDSIPLLQRVNTSVTVPDDILEKAVAIERMLCPMKVLCIFDCAMNAYYFFVSPFVGGLLCIISFNGYLSTVYFKRSLLLCYMLYQYLQVTGRTAALVLSITELPHAGNQAGNQTGSGSVNVTETGLIPDGAGPVLLGGLLVLQIYIAYYVTLFYTKLPTRADLERVTFVSI